MDYFQLLYANDIHGLTSYLKSHDVNEKLYNQTLLYWASYHNNLSFVEHLINHDADANIKDRYSRTPLLIACYYGFYQIVEFLLEHNVDLEGCLEWSMKGWDNQPQTKIVELIENKVQNVF